MKAFRRLDVRTAFDKWTPNFLVLSLLGWAFWPIIDSALQGDDVPNSMRSAVLRSVSQSRWTAITQSVGQWLKNEGRFFPVSAIENVYLFSTIHSVTLYKFCQWLSVIVLIALFSWFATSMSGVRQFYPLFLLAIGAAIQTRNWYDPTFGFGLLLQSTFLKVVLSAILLHRVVTRKPTKFALVTSTILWMAALLQYEISITLLPVFAIVAFIASDTHRVRKLLFVVPHTAIALGYLIMSQMVRSGKAPSPAYTTNSKMSVLGPTYLKQLSGGFPFSQHIWGISKGNFFDSVARPELIVTLAIAIVVLVTAGRAIAEPSFQRFKIVGLLLIGVNMVLGPGLPTSMSQRWQSELIWGNGYLPVYFQYFGVGLVLSSMTILAMSIGGKVSVSRHAVVAVFTTVLVLLLTSNSATLRANVVAQVGQRESRELYESAVRLGIFRGVPDGSIVMSNEADPNTWINGYFTAWLGGPENLIFVRNDDELKDQCLKNDCDIRPRFDLHSYIDSYDQPWITLRNRPMELAQTGKIRGPVIRKVAGKRDAVLRATDCAARGPSTWGRKYAVVACSAE